MENINCGVAANYCEVGTKLGDIQQAVTSSSLNGLYPWTNISRCPSCGYCPSCGRTDKYQPYYPYTPYSPSWTSASGPLSNTVYYGSTDTSSYNLATAQLTGHPTQERDIPFCQKAGSLYKLNENKEAKTTRHLGTPTKTN